MGYALFAWNCKRQINRLTTRAKPVKPVEITKKGNFSLRQQHMKELEISHTVDFRSTQSNINLLGLIEQLKTQSILGYIIQSVLHLQEFMDAFTERCQNRTVYRHPGFPLVHQCKNGNVYRRREKDEFFGTRLN